MKTLATILFLLLAFTSSAQGRYKKPSELTKESLGVMKAFPYANKLDGNEIILVLQQDTLCRITIRDALKDLMGVRRQESKIQFGFLFMFLIIMLMLSTTTRRRGR